MSIEIKPDEKYVATRNSFIPLATRLSVDRARAKQPKDWKGSNPPQHLEAREFSRVMVEMSVAAGIVDKGNLILFNAKRLPDSWRG